MKRNFVISLFGGLIGSAIVLMLLSAVSIVGAQSAEVQAAVVSRPNAMTAAMPLTSTFTYQGQLISNNIPVNNICDFMFTLVDAPSGPGTAIGTQAIDNVSVSRGLFTVVLNTDNQFGDTAFNGDARWLIIAVRCPAGSGVYQSLSPRQPLTSLPFALPGLRTFPNATSPNIVGGLSGNSIISTAVGSTIGGGGVLGLANMITNSYAFIGGGYGNFARGYSSVIGGGYNNEANGDQALIGGGGNNRANGAYAVISGGYTNQASGYVASIGGGYNNQSNGTQSAVGGGYNNIASGFRSTIPGGENNQATLTDTLAAGQQAQALHQGVFVWGDSTNAAIASTKPDQFVIRASNGVSLSVNAGESKPIDVGERYRDNAIIAWADIAGNGSIGGEFGVTSVSHSTGVYTITLDATAVDSFHLVPIAIAEVDAPPTSAASARLVTINLVDAHTFIVYVTNGSYALVDNQILFMATAR